MPLLFYIGLRGGVNFDGTTLTPKLGAQAPKRATAHCAHDAARLGRDTSHPKTRAPWRACARRSVSGGRGIATRRDHHPPGHPDVDQRPTPRRPRVPGTPVPRATTRRRRYPRSDDKASRTEVVHVFVRVRRPSPRPRRHHGPGPRRRRPSHHGGPLPEALPSLCAERRRARRPDQRHLALDPGSQAALRAVPGEKLAVPVDRSRWQMLSD